MSQIGILIAIMVSMAFVNCGPPKVKDLSKSNLANGTNPSPSPSPSPSPGPTPTPTPTPTPGNNPAPVLSGFTPPELPNTFINTDYSAPSNVVNVSAGADLQSALNSATLGTTLVLPAGETFTGNFTLPNKSGNGWIYVISSQLSGMPAGQRVSPGNASQMPKIVSTNVLPALSTAANAHHYRFVGIEIATTWSSTSNTHTNLINIEAPNQTSTSVQPNNIIFDRCYIHGTSSGDIRRGIAGNGAYISVIDSYLSEFHENGADSQAFLAYNGTGPFKLVNNEFQGAGENVMFGGSDAANDSLRPADMEIRGKRFFKPLSWMSSSWVVKNNLEFKDARRVLVERNILENNWRAVNGQNGFSLLITPRNQDGSCPTCGTQDILVRFNKFINVGQGINILGEDDNHASTRTDRILIHDNFIEVTGLGGASGRGVQILGGPRNVIIDHNTILVSGTLAFVESNPRADRFAFTNNIGQSGDYGFAGTGTGAGNSTLNTYFTNFVFTTNAIIGGTNSYPTGNFFPANNSAVGFASDYSLLMSSPFHNQGSDGRDLGADFTALP